MKIGILALLGACNGAGAPSQPTGGMGAELGAGSDRDGGVLPDGAQPAHDLAGGDLTVLPGTADLAGPNTPDLAAGRVQSTLSFSGCAVDLTGMVVVAANNDSIAVSNVGSPFSSLQVALGALTGPQVLSTAARVANGLVVNAIAGTTWTNISSDMPDPIHGTLTINAYDLGTGVLDLKFADVTLQNVEDKSLCVVNGTLKTSGKSF
jgi:hypothetical protein